MCCTLTAIGNLISDHSRRLRSRIAITDWDCGLPSRIALVDHRQGSRSWIAVSTRHTSITIENSTGDYDPYIRPMESIDPPVTYTMSVWGPDRGSQSRITIEGHDSHVAFVRHDRGSFKYQESYDAHVREISSLIDISARDFSLYKPLHSQSRLWSIAWSRSRLEIAIHMYSTPSSRGSVFYYISEWAGIACPFLRQSTPIVLNDSFDLQCIKLDPLCDNDGLKRIISIQSW